MPILIVIPFVLTLTMQFFAINIKFFIPKVCVIFIILSRVTCVIFLIVLIFITFIIQVTYEMFISLLIKLISQSIFTIRMIFKLNFFNLVGIVVEFTSLIILFKVSNDEFLLQAILLSFE